MDAFLNGYRELYARLGKARARWEDHHGAGSALFGAVVNAFERLPALERAIEGKTYGDALDETFAERVVGAQFEALDRLFGRLVEECDALEAVARELERVKTDAWARMRSVDPPPKRAGMERSGPQPSVAECVLGLEEAWRMHRDESALRRELVREARACRDPEELKILHRLFVAQPNLDPEELRLIADRVPLKNVEASSRIR